MGLSPTVWPCVSIALTHSNLLGFQTMACTPQDSKTFNLADEIFPKDKVAPPPKKPGKQPRKKDTGATTKPSTSSHTPAPNQHGDDVSNEEVEPGNQAAPELANLFKEQFAAMQVHLEGFVSKLVDSRTSVQPAAAIQPGKRKRTEVDDESAYGLFSELSEDEETDSEEDVLEDIAQQLRSPSDVGPAVSDKLATVINGLFQSRPSEERVKDLVDNYKCPKNIEVGSAPVNQEIWSSLNKDARAGDLKLQRIGARMASAAYAMCNLMQQLYDCRTENKELDIKHALKVGMDVMLLSCSAAQKIADHRRNALRPAISPQFRAICGKQESESHELLFGKDLIQRVKDIKETARLGASYNLACKAPRKENHFLGRRANDFHQRNRMGAPAPARQQWKQRNHNAQGNTYSYNRRQDRASYKKTAPKQ